MSTPKESPTTSPKPSAKTSPNVSAAVIKKSVENVSSAYTKSTSKIPAVEDDENGDIVEFIYGGPFIPLNRPDKFLPTATPVNMQLQGTFKKSHAHQCLKDRLPTILTKVIDYSSRNNVNRSYIEYVAKLKNELVTNKNYEKFTIGTPEAEKWNTWIDNCDVPNYFMNTWVFTECYVYRRLREAAELCNINVDPFIEQKTAGLNDNIEPMCVVAEKMKEMLEPKSIETDKVKIKDDFITLVKIALWANKCDMSMTAGERVTLNVGPPPDPPNAPPVVLKKGKAPPPPYVSPGYVDPFPMIGFYKLNTLTDDSGKAFENLLKRSAKIRAAIEKQAGLPFKQKCSCTRLAKLAGLPIAEPPPKAQSPPATPAPPPAAPAAGAPPAEEVPEPPKIPCPSKMVVPQAVIFDIVCDNAGYELFADLCVGHFLIAQGIVDKVKFHLKKYPWFVSDATIDDFNRLLNLVKTSNYSHQVTVPPSGENPETTMNISGESLRALGTQWDAYLQGGQFIICQEDYWTYPHGYKDMKKYDPNMYRQLQFSAMILFKGDLNYRKLLNDKNCVQIQGFEPSLEGFIPAPILALRTIKSELACAMPKAKAGKPSRTQELDQIYPGWMTTGNYGVIQFCAKAEPFKPSPLPCWDYGTTCFGTGCPLHTDI